jgi:type I restriction enzyme M protein
MVTVIDPEPRETVHDPACGTGGFLLAAWEHMRKKPLARNAEIYTAMRSRFSGVDIVPEVVRLCTMNLYLHDIAGRESPVEARDALLGDGGKTYDVILTNPPFGKKQSYRIVRDDGEIDTEREDYDRQDFFVTTSNKQLNFLQHIMTVLAENGRAAVVMPDNAVRGRRRRDDPPPVIAQFRFPHASAIADRHFLQAGRQGERFVLRQEAGLGRAEHEGIVDLRSAYEPALHVEERPMTRADLDDFVACYNRGGGTSAPRPNGSGVSRMPSSWPATRSISTSSGSRTMRSTTPTCCRRPTRSPPRSSRTLKLRSNAFARSR